MALKTADELERWFTPDRFQIAWNLAKREMPVWLLVAELDYSMREIYRWLNGYATPRPRALAAIDELFTKVLGNDWRSIVDRVLEGGDK